MRNSGENTRRWREKVRTLLSGSVFLSLILIVFSAFCILTSVTAETGKENRIKAAAYSGVEKVRRFPKDVRVCGVEVGGKEKNAAFKLIREEEERRIPAFYADTADGTEIFYPFEIGFTDNLNEVFAKAVKGGSYETEMRCYLKGAGKERIIAAVTKPKKNAAVSFGKNGFSYEKEENGVRVDESKLSAALEKALCSLTSGEHGYAFPRFSAAAYAYEEKADFTLRDALKSTQKLASFTTRFSAAAAGRCRNIALAASSLNGSVIEAGQTLSFNKTVGERTVKRGYSEAKIIQDGEFISGVGGGVCQVSTTLFNAALLSGLNVTERRAHSLSVSYVPPSRDAMVSSASDLKIQNPFSFPVYLQMRCESETVTATFYGTRGNKTYTLGSEVTDKIPPPAAEVKQLSSADSAKFPEGTEKVTIRAEREGIKSVLYRNTYVNGKLTAKKRLFSDRYSPVRGIVGILAKKAEETPNNSE